MVHGDQILQLWRERSPPKIMPSSHGEWLDWMREKIVAWSWSCLDFGWGKFCVLVKCTTGSIFQRNDKNEHKIYVVLSCLFCVVSDFQSIISLWFYVSLQPKLKLTNPKTSSTIFRVTRFGDPVVHWSFALHRTLHQSQLSISVFNGLDSQTLSYRLKCLITGMKVSANLDHWFSRWTVMICVARMAVGTLYLGYDMTQGLDHLPNSKKSCGNLLWAPFFLDHWFPRWMIMICAAQYNADDAL